MSSIFKKLFSRNRIPLPEPETGPDKALFVADEAPEPKPAFKGSIIKQFINEDHYTAGLLNGYQIHDKSDLAFQKNCLIGKFQHAVSSIQEQMQDELSDKLQKLVQIGNLLPTQKDLLELSIKEIKDKLEALNIQKALSVDGEGWVSRVLNDFERGYKKGIQDYLDEGTYLSRQLI